MAWQCKGQKQSWYELHFLKIIPAMARDDLNIREQWHCYFNTESSINNVRYFIHIDERCSLYGVMLFSLGFVRRKINKKILSIYLVFFRKFDFSRLLSLYNVVVIFALSFFPVGWLLQLVTLFQFREFRFITFIENWCRVAVSQASFSTYIVSWCTVAVSQDSFSTYIVNWCRIAVSQDNFSIYIGNWLTIAVSHEKSN